MDEGEKGKKKEWGCFLHPLVLRREVWYGCDALLDVVH